jgi:AmmeMemoRadiSam system protein A
VTLTEHGELRGCIGHIFPKEPLYRAIMDNARNAALSDPRFPPVGINELDKIDVEVSVLSEPAPLKFDGPGDLLAKLQPHKDGVVLQIGQNMATFLPQVWEQLPERAEFLNHLSLKAGCAADAWRGPKTSVQIYHVEAFKEK